MKKILYPPVIAAICLCASLSGAQRTGAQTPRVVAPSATKQTPVATASSTTVEPDAKVVQYTSKAIIKVKTKIRFTTVIVLPATERILDFVCGDKEFWVVNGNQNLAYVKPAKTGAQTNLNLITASGNIYSFLLAEISEIPGTDADLKVFVESRDESVLSMAAGPPKFVAAQAMDECRTQIELAKQETQRAKDQTQAAIDRGISRFTSSLRFSYRFVADQKPFQVRAIYNDGKFTFIHTRSQQAAAVYEIQDNTPNFVNFKYDKGVYIVDKVLDRGYLAIGKQKLTFARED